MIPRRLHNETSLSISRSIINPTFRSHLINESGAVRGTRLPGFLLSREVLTARFGSGTGHNAQGVASQLGDNLVIGPVQAAGVGDIGAQPQLYHAPASLSPDQVANQRVGVLGLHPLAALEPDHIFDPGPQPGRDLSLVIGHAVVKFFE